VRPITSPTSERGRPERPCAPSIAPALAALPALLLALVWQAPSRADAAARPKTSAPAAAAAQARASTRPHGPAVWRIDRGGAEVWVLAAPAALAPYDWDSSAIEKLIARSRMVYTSARLSAGPLGALSLVLSGAYREPDGRTLADLMVPDDWRRFQAVTRAADLEPKDWMSLRPALSSVLLPSAAMAKRHAVRVEARVETLARRSHVPVRPIATYDVAPLLKELVGIPDARAIACLDEAVSDVAFESAHLEALTRAWSTGDLAALKSQYRPELGFACVTRLAGLDRALDLSIADTARGVRDALAQGDRALFVVSLNLFLRPDGVAEMLRRQGYTVEPLASAASQ
jgi:uncharacterized protein YbaP (TraB family)